VGVAGGRGGTWNWRGEVPSIKAGWEQPLDVQAALRGSEIGQRGRGWIKRKKIRPLCKLEKLQDFAPFVGSISL